MHVRVTDDAASDELAEWDEFVDAVASSDVTQLSRWSAVRAEAGFKALHLFACRSGGLVGGAQVLVRPLPVLGSIGYISAGPVIADELDDRAEVVSALAATMEKLLHTRMRVLFVQPPPGADDVSSALLERGFRLSRAGIAPSASVRVDLTVDETQLEAGLDSLLRRWTKRWPHRGVTVRLGEATDLPVLADLLAKSAAHQGYEPLSVDYLKVLYESLAPAGNAALLVGAS